MGLLGSIIAKGVMTAATNSTIKAVGDATATVIATKANNRTEKDDIIVKNGVVLIKPTRSSEDYQGENALEIAREFLGVGFESVTLKPIHRLNERAKKRYGEIDSISFNGKDEFLGIKKVPVSSYIVIEYLDFKKNVDVEVYASVAKITPVTMKRNESKESIQENNTKSANELKRFCPYCGAVLPVIDAKFCSSCGKEI